MYVSIDVVRSAVTYRETATCISAVEADACRETESVCELIA